MTYTVKQLSDLAGVSVRTLHYYHEIGLLDPSRVGQNGYRYYEEEALFRLQQILFFRELDLSLNEVKAIVDMPDFDLLAALQAHRDGLESRIRRLHGLIKTIDSTILHLTGEVEMSQEQFFAAFNEKEEKQYEQEARQKWGEAEVGATYKRWNSYTPQQHEKIKAESRAIYHNLVSVMAQGPASPEVQQVIGRWHQHMRYFYEPSIERLRGLAQLYNEHPDFVRTFSEFHPDLPAFIREAIEYYCHSLNQA